MNYRKKVAVVILGWNGRSFLEQFLPSVVKHSSFEWSEVVVADNASTDDSVPFVRKNFPTVRIIENQRNEGFAAGYNVALRQVDADYYVLLNQDLEVTAGWLQPVIQEMERREGVVAAQPKIKSYTERQRFEYAGASGGFLDVYGYAYCRGRLFDSVEDDKGQYDAVEEIFWATGACMFIRSEVYHQAGGLDADFFAHQEEIDLCWRIRNMGGKILCVPSSVVYHVGGGSLPQGNPRKTYLNFRNNLMMMFKNLPASEIWWKVFVVRLFLDGLAALYSLVKNKNVNDLIAILKAHWAFYMSLPRLLKKRKAMTDFSSAELTKQSVVWQYYALGRRKFSELKSRENF